MNINNNFRIKICCCCFAGARIRPYKTAAHLKNLYGINERKYEAFRKWKENASDCVHRRRFIIKRQKRKMDNFICTSLSRPHCITCLQSARRGQYHCADLFSSGLLCYSRNSDIALRNTCMHYGVSISCSAWCSCGCCRSEILINSPAAYCVLSLTLSIDHHAL